MTTLKSKTIALAVKLNFEAEFITYLKNLNSRTILSVRYRSLQLIEAGVKI